MASCLILLVVAAVLANSRGEPARVQASGPTIIHGGTISTNTTWTLADSPYIVQAHLTIADGAVLTIEPGVEVRIAGEQNFLVNGRLVAEGTASQHITFTSNAASPMAGDWYYIRVAGSASLNYVDIGYGGRGGWNLMEINNTSDVQIRNSHFHHSASGGIYLAGPAISPVITNVTVDNCAGAAIYQNTVDMTPTYRDLTLVSNGTDAVAINGGNVTRDMTLDGSGLVNGKPFLLFVASPTIDVSKTLTVTPGSELRIAAWQSFNVNGRLVAEGTASKPITFTSGAASPMAGDWYYIRVAGSASLNYVDIGYGGRGGWNLMEINNTSDVQIRNAHFHDSASDGLYLLGDGIHPFLDNVAATDNVGYGIRQSTVDMVPTYQNIEILRNGQNAIYLPGGTLNNSLTLTGAPYRLGNINVSPAASVQIQPGASLQFERFEGLNISGSLNAQGTHDKPIRFTSVLTTPVEGSWKGITALAGSSVNLSGCIIEGAEIGVDAQSSMLIDQCTVRYNTEGIVASGNAEVTIFQSEVYGNTSFGVRNAASGVTTRAMINWWGDQSGPNHATNAGGQGDKVSDGVVFRPWLSAPPVGEFTRAALAVTPTATLTREISGRLFDDFVVRASSTDNLIVEVRPVTPVSTSFMLLGRFGSLPLPMPRETDQWTDQSRNGVYRLTVAADITGDYYFSVIPAGPVTYQFHVYTETYRLMDVSPGRVPPEPVALHADGIFRLGRAPVNLCTNANPQVASGRLDAASPTEGRISLDLTGVDQGQYSLCIDWPDGSHQTLSNVLEVHAGVGQLSARIETPSLARAGRSYVAWLIYANTGDAPLPSPLFVITATGALMGPKAESDFTDTLRIMGFASELPVDRLKPGAEVRVPIYFKVTGNPLVFYLSDIDDEDTEAFPWDQIETQFKPESPPPDWNQLWLSSTSSIGITWGDVIQYLNTSTGLLTSSPAPSDMDSMLAFWIVEAMGETSSPTSEVVLSWIDSSTNVTFTCAYDESGKQDFAYSAAGDVKTLNRNMDTEYNPADFNPEYPTFIITHGNNDNTMSSVSSQYTTAATSIWSKLGGKVNILKLNWPTGAEGINLRKKTQCLNSEGQNLIQFVGQTAADSIRLKLPKIDCSKLFLVGHSFGNAVNYDLAMNLCEDTKPTGIVLDPAGKDGSGLHITDYSKAFNDNSFAVYTDSLFDEKLPQNLGVDSYRIESAPNGPPVPNGFKHPYVAHKFGLTDWFPKAIDSCWKPNEPLDPDRFVPKPTSKEKGLGEQPKPKLLNPKSFPSSVVVSVDPNDKVVWSPRVAEGEVVRYTIRFENVMTATAPAQDVVIVDTLDPRFDFTSLRFLDVGFGDQTILLSGQALNQGIEQNARIPDYRPTVTTTWDLSIQASVDQTSGQIHWLFQTLDPKTGLPPEDALAGFLPPNDSNGRGEGRVTFEVRVKPDVTEGTRIPNLATITFDVNDPIVTPTAYVTVGNLYTIYLPILQRNYSP